VNDERTEAEEYALPTLGPNDLPFRAKVLPCRWCGRAPSAHSEAEAEACQIAFMRSIGE
jgi:hypothetical protein